MELCLIANCTECRLVGSSNVDSERSYSPVLRQLLYSVKELAHKVMEGSDSSKRCSTVPDRLLDRLKLQADPPRQQMVSRKNVLSQVRELKEREKRADSVIFRGFGDVTLEEVNTLFESICQELNFTVIPLTGLTKLPVPSGLYRARVPNAEQRRALLSKAPELRFSTRFSRFYIDRDLTKQQRDEIVERRRKLRLDQNDTEVIQENGREVSPPITLREEGRSNVSGANGWNTQQQAGVSSVGWSRPGQGSQVRGRGGCRGRGSRVFNSQHQNFRDIPHIRSSNF